MSLIEKYKKRKKENSKIAMITCYDYSSALIIAKTHIDWVLVGDSSSMVMHGATHTTQSTLSQIDMHTAAVAKGLNGKKLIVADLPFMSYHKSKQHTLESVELLVRSGATAVKLEGAGDDVLQSIASIISAGVPVMGHLGLTPQHVNQFDGYKVQGRSDESADALVEQALSLEKAGCFSIVLECIPQRLAKKITSALSIPTIGIGAGVETDGQVLVFHDLLGMQSDFKPRFVKRYLQGEKLFIESIEAYVNDVKTCQFPANEHVFE